MPQLKQETLQMFRSLSESERAAALGRMSREDKLVLLAQLETSPFSTPAARDVQPITSPLKPQEVSTMDVIKGAPAQAGPYVKAAAMGPVNAVLGVPGALKEAGAALLSEDAPRFARFLLETIKGPVSMVTTPARGATALALPNQVQAPSEEEFQQAASAAGANAAATIIPGIVKGVSRAVPTTAKAGAKFEKVMSAAKNEPINTATAERIAGEAETLSKHGARLPKVLKDFINTHTDAGGPLSYKTGRDFATNAGNLSAREASGASPVMRKKLTEFTEAMKTANRDAAARVGMGELYDQAMKEYRRAKTIEETARIVKKWTFRAALTAAGIKAYGVLTD